MLPLENVRRFPDFGLVNFDQFFPQNQPILGIPVKPFGRTRTNPIWNEGLCPTLTQESGTDTHLENHFFSLM
jgi:hypothetical protein